MGEQKMQQIGLCFWLLVGFLSGEVNSCFDPEPARNVRVTNVNSEDKLFVTWTEPGGKIDYYKVILMGDVTNTIRTKSTEATFTGLLPGREYSITVHTVIGNCSSAAFTLTEATYPSCPGSVVFMYNVSGCISLVWEEPEKMSTVAKKFNITVESNCNDDTSNVLSDQPAFNLTGLRAGCEYTFAVATVGARQYSSQLQKLSIITALTSNFAGAPIAALPESNNPDIAYPRKLRSIKLSDASTSLPTSNDLDITIPTYLITSPASTDTIPIFSTLEMSNTAITSNPEDATTAIPESFATTTDSTFSATTTDKVLTTMLPTSNIIPTNSVLSSSIFSTLEIPSTISTTLSSTPPSTFTSTSPTNRITTVTIPATTTTITSTADTSTFTSTPAISSTSAYFFTSTATTFTTSPPTPTTTTSLMGSTTFIKPSTITGTGTSVAPIIATNANSTDMLMVSWLPVSGNISYYNARLTGDVFQDINTTLTKATFTELLPGRVYTVTVRAVNGSDIYMAAQLTEATYPTPPGQLSPPSMKADTVVLTWQDPVGMTGTQKSFRVSVEAKSSFRSRKLSDVIITNSSTVTISGLTPGTYTIAIVTVGALQYLSAALMTSITVPTIPSQVPLGVILGAVLGSIGGVTVFSILAFMIWKIIRKRKNSSNCSNSGSCSVSSKTFVAIYENREKNNAGFVKEFESLQCVGALQTRFIATHPDNATKNHPEAIFPYDESLVKLSIPKNGYINASFIPGHRSKKEFIAAQSPLPETVDDFWHMIWEQRIRTIVTLPSDQNRETSEDYWPSQESRLYGNILITFVKEHPSKDWTYRELMIINVKMEKQFQVHQFQLISWPASEDREERVAFLEFSLLVHHYMKEHHKNNPTLVHCKTGGSRSGIFLALNCILTRLEDSDSVDIHGTVYDLLLHRPAMIQTLDEYIFLHRCTLDIIRAWDQKHEYYNIPNESIYETINHFPSILEKNHDIYVTIDHC